jgi:tRNA modification GTPase
MESAYSQDDLIQALATPRGRSALAVIRSSGAGCVEAVARLFSRYSALNSSAGNRVHHGWIVDGAGRKVDEVLVAVYRAPASYTGEDSVEISCHGGPTVVDRITDLLRSEGFRDAAPGEFTFRAFAAGKMDLTRAEAVREIIDARTDRARSLAASRLAGSISASIDSVKYIVKIQAATASLALDYPEDEVEEVSFDYEAVCGARDSLLSLAGTWSTGKLYRDGLKVILAGPANAGKSSLFNLFLREERSIVTEQPGTTRDWLEAWLNLDGVPLRLVDTAGLRRDTQDPIEREGMRRTRALLAGSDLVMAVADGSEGASAALEMEREELSEIVPDGNLQEDSLIRVWNKADLAPEAPEGWIPVCATSGAGFPELERELRKRALSRGAASEGDAPVIDSIRQKTLLETAAAALDRFVQAGSGSITVPVDLQAEDLHDALDALGELTGTVTRTDVLNTLFSEFCVGK